MAKKKKVIRKKKIAPWVPVGMTITAYCFQSPRRGKVFTPSSLFGPALDMEVDMELGAAMARNVGAFRSVLSVPPLLTVELAGPDYGGFLAHATRLCKFQRVIKWKIVLGNASTFFRGKIMSWNLEHEFDRWYYRGIGHSFPLGSILRFVIEVDSDSLVTK